MESFRFFGFRETIDGKQAKYTEAGFHFRMGIPYAFVVVLAAGGVIVKSGGTLKPLAGPAAAGIVALLLGTNTADECPQEARRP